METDFSNYSQAATSGPDFSSASMGLSDEAMASIGGDENQDQSFFGGSDTSNVMDFGRGSVSNITNASNYDPNFAALGMIGRGITPSFDLRNQISFDVPSQMLPQLEGKYGPIGAKYYSPFERFLQEDFAEIMQKGPGITGLIGRGLDLITSSFRDAKDTLGKMGDAVGGVSLSDLFSSDNPMSNTPNEQANMGTLDPSDRFLGDMSQQGAGFNVTDPVVSAPTSVNMASVPQVSPMFDQFGNPYRSGFDRNMAEMAQQSLSGGIASVAPSQAQEVGDAMKDTFVTTTPNLNLPGFRSKSMSEAEAEEIKRRLGIN